MIDRAAIRAGMAGAVLVAICCAAPLLAVGLPLAGLGACTSMTLRMYAQRKDLDLQSVEVHLSHSKIHAKDCDDCGDGKAARLDRVERKIAVTGDLSPAERKRLLEIAEMCPVHRTLESGSTVVVSSLVDA